MGNGFGENLQRLMKDRNYSGRSLAKKIDVPAKTVNEWVGANARMPRQPEVLKKLAEVLDVSIHELLFGEPDPKSLIREILEKTEIHTGLYEISIKKVKSKGRK